MLRLIPFALLLLTGCNLPWDREKYDRTPAGWHVHWLERGTLEAGLHSRLQLYQLFDAAMERSFPECATKVGLPESKIRSTIRENDALYTLVDSFYFNDIGQPTDANGTTTASGETLDRFEVYVAFFNRDAPGPVDPNAVPVDAPSWTIKPSVSFPGKVYYGEEDLGNQYPALGYELHWQFTNAP
jgi:hypothetical protein